MVVILGPWTVPAYAIGDPQALDIRLRVNGTVKQRATIKQMIFNVRAIVSDLSSGMTDALHSVRTPLEPGDIIATGTPDGVGFARKPPEYFHDGG